VAKVQGVPLTVARHVFVVNNYFHVLSVWSGQRFSMQSTGGANEAVESHLNSHDHHYGEQHGDDGTTSPNGETRRAHSFSRAAGGSLSDLSGHGRGGGGDDDDDDDRSSVSSTATGAAAVAALGSSNLQLAARLVHAMADFRALKETYTTAASELAGEALRLAFNGFVSFVESASAEAASAKLDPTKTLSPELQQNVIKVGRAFSASLKNDLAIVVETIKRFIKDPANATEVIKMAFTELVVINTRFHGIASAALGGTGTATLRQVVVTSQQLLHLMKRATGV
jgi:hypothetical protein